MLIRLVSHFKFNPKHIDKLIAIKGLPEDWIFNETPEGKELKRPWTPDVDKNIPMDIRQFCEPTYITIKYPPLSAGVPGIVERKQILGIVLDFMTEPGREMWEKVERFIEGTIPRNERVPQAVVCAKDEHSIFETYEPKKSSTGSIYLDPAQVPEIDLRPYLIKPSVVLESPVAVVAQAPLPTPQAADFSCEQCHKVFDKPRALRMHAMKAHPNKEKVSV